MLKKENDSLWLSTIYIKNNKKKIHTAYYKTKYKKLVTGKTTHYNFKGKESSVRFYDFKGSKTGTYTNWFDNGKVNFIGAYEEGKQEGAWKFYHTNGTLGAEKIYNKGELEKETFYDEKGKVLPKGSFINRKENSLF